MPQIIGSREPEASEKKGPVKISLVIVILVLPSMLSLISYLVNQEVFSIQQDK